MVKIDTNKCIGCKKCINDCISMSLTMQEDKVVYSGKCINCGHCVAICPANAVEIPEYDMQDIEEHKNDNNLDINKLIYNIKARRSIRDYKNIKIEQEKLDNIIQAGRYTATAVNLQSSKFIVVQDKLDELRDMIWKDIDKNINNTEVFPIEIKQVLQRLIGLRDNNNIDYLFRNAPAVIYIATNNNIDAGLAAQNIELASVAQGLGVLYNGYLTHVTNSNKNVLEWFELTDKQIAICMLVGYPEKSYLRTVPRRKADIKWL